MSVLKVVLRNKPKVDGTRPLAIRIYKDGKESYIYLGYYILPDHWDAKAGKIKKPHPNVVRFNNLIAQKLAEAMEKALEIDASNENVSASLIKQKVKPKGGRQFFGQADLYLTILKEAGKYNRYSADQSKVQHFKDFVGNDLPFSEVTVAMLERFKHHLITKLKVGERTAVNHWVVVRSIFSQAIKNGVADQKYYPFGRGKIVIKFPETQKVGLSADDVKKLENVKLTDPLHNHARNLWLFAFYFGGMRASDVLRSKWSEFRDDRIYYTMGKNLKPVSLKIPEKATRILNIYRREQRHANDFVFPELRSITDLDDNFAIQKRIAESISRIDQVLRKSVLPKANISGKVTMHIARHTFGKIAGDSIAPTIAQKLFRHSDLATTILYMNNFIHQEEDEALDNVVNFTKIKSIKNKKRKAKFDLVVEI